MHSPPPLPSPPAHLGILASPSHHPPLTALQESRWGRRGARVQHSQWVLPCHPRKEAVGQGGCRQSSLCSPPSLTALQVFQLQDCRQPTPPPPTKHKLPPHPLFCALLPLPHLLSPLKTAALPHHSAQQVPELRKLLAGPLPRHLPHPLFFPLFPLGCSPAQKCCLPPTHSSAGPSLGKVAGSPWAKHS